MIPNGPGGAANSCDAFRAADDDAPELDVAANPYVDASIPNAAEEANDVKKAAKVAKAQYLRLENCRSKTRKV